MKLKDVAYPIKSWRVPSQSDVGVYYTVELMSDGKFICDCPAGVFQRKGRSCRHREIVKEFLKKQENKT